MTVKTVQHISDIHRVAELFTRFNEPPKIHGDLTFFTGDITNSWISYDLAKDFYVGDNRVHFIRGNHDTYGSIFESVPRNIEKQLAEVVTFKYENTHILKMVGWYDAIGFNWNNFVAMNDMRYSFLYRGWPVDLCKRITENLVQMILENFENELKLIIEKEEANVSNLLIATHVPFFNNTNDIDSLSPLFLFKQAGELLVKYADHFKFVNVLCGHSHKTRTMSFGYNIIQYETYGERNIYIDM